MENEKLSKEPRAGDRLQIAFDILETLPSARDYETASKQIIDSLNIIEQFLQRTGKISSPMTTFPIDPGNCVDTARGKLYFEDRYFSHTVFVAYNGAIDVRKRDDRDELDVEKLEFNPVFPRDEMVLEFAKAGEDGRTVWEAIS